MPIYEYSCNECGHELEALQKMSDDPLTDCPKCGNPALVKKISAAAFRLSGSGWYETDFKSGKKKNLAGDTGKSDSSASSSGESKTSQSTGTDSSSSGKTTNKTSSTSAKAG